MDAAPLRWLAPQGTAFPQSDPAPAGKPSAAPQWPLHPWQQRAREVLEQGLQAHLTLIDAEGFPLPIRARSAILAPEGFLLELPAGIPWKAQGKGSLCFMGAATFIGHARAADRGIVFVVERILPTLPTVADPRELWSPSETTRTAFMGRLTAELGRRGSALPHVAVDPPAPTRGSLLRAQRMARMVAESALRHAAADT
jgi:hypothetical protein